MSGKHALSRNGVQKRAQNKSLIVTNGENV